jgi:N-formylmaleamate deformylase
MAWQAHDVRVNGIQLHYQRTGGEKPIVVLVHGMTDYSLYWSRVVRALEDTYDIILYDMRGHGHSDAPETGYTPEDYANDLLGLISVLGLKRPAVVGHSLGATTTLTAAALDPHVFGCIVLEDPPWPAHAATVEQSAGFAETWKASMSARQQCEYEERIAHCLAEHPTWHSEDCQRRAESDVLVRLQIFSGFIPMFTQPWQAFAAKITCPALLIASDPLLGGIVTPAVAEEFARITPRGHVTTIPGAGHAIHREQLDRFVDAVHAFIAEHGIVPGTIAS